MRPGCDEAGPALPVLAYKEYVLLRFSVLLLLATA